MSHSPLLPLPADAPQSKFRNKRSPSSMEDELVAMPHLFSAQHHVRLGYHALSIGAFRWVDLLGHRATASLRAAGAESAEALQGPAGLMLARIENELEGLRRAWNREVQNYGGLEAVPAMEAGEDGLWVALTCAQDVADGLVSTDDPQLVGALATGLSYVDSRLQGFGHRLCNGHALLRADLQAVVAGSAVLSMLQGIMALPALEPLRSLFRDILFKVLDLLHRLGLQQGNECYVFRSLGLLTGGYVHCALRWIVGAFYSGQYLDFAKGYIVNGCMGLRLVYGVPPSGAQDPQAATTTTITTTTPSSAAASGDTSGGSSPLSSQGAVVRTAGPGRRRKRKTSRLATYLKVDAQAPASRVK